MTFVAALSIGIGLTWRFCSGSSAYLLFLVGCALVQVASSKIPMHDGYNGAAMQLWALPPLFLNPRVRFAVHGVAFLTLPGEFAVGLARHSWAAALLLWIPPLVGACGVFNTSRPNPTIPLFLGCAALLGACTLLLV